MSFLSPHRIASGGARFRRALMVGCLALVLAGCGASLVYPRLDTVVAYYLEDLVSLDDVQSEQLSRTLSANLDWHRSSELGKYAAFLRELAGTVEEGADGAAWLQAAQRTEEYWRDIFEQAAPGYIAVARTLTDAQVDELIRNLEKRDERTWREFAERTPEQRRVRREKSVTRALERFTGPLSPEQRAMIRDYSASARPFMAEWRANRRVWRGELAATLAGRQSDPGFTERMTRLIARPDDLWTPEYQAAVERSRVALVDLLAEVDASLTERQRGRARGELLSLADEVQGLAGRRG